jgi:hypothetical protein
VTVSTEDGWLAVVERHERLQRLLVIEHVHERRHRQRLLRAANEVADHHAELFDFDGNVAQRLCRLLSDDDNTASVY